MSTSSQNRTVDVEFNPKVSIIIPVYNGSNYLRDAIDSALAQIYKNIEVIVVNDGSNDGGKTEAIIRSYKDGVRYFYKENGGVATALNMGIKEAEGEYISWLSHDDLYLPNKLERQINYLNENRNNKVILYSDFEALDLRNKSSHIISIKYIDSGNYFYDVLLLLFNSSMHGCTMLIPRDCFGNVGLFNERLKTTQDYEFWFRLLRNRYEFKHLPEILIKTRWHEEQGTLSMSDLHFKEVEALYCWASDFFCEEFKSFSYKQVRGIITALKRRTLREAPQCILRIWREDNNYRLILSGLMESCHSLADLKEIYLMLRGVTPVILRRSLGNFMNIFRGCISKCRPPE